MLIAIDEPPCGVVRPTEAAKRYYDKADRMFSSTFGANLGDKVVMQKPPNSKCLRAMVHCIKAHLRRCIVGGTRTQHPLPTIRNLIRMIAIDARRSLSDCSQVPNAAREAGVEPLTKGLRRGTVKRWDKQSRKKGKWPCTQPHRTPWR